MAILKDAMFAALGLIATQQIPQLVLGAQNTSYTGYLANAAVAASAAYGAGKGISRQAGQMVGIGGMLYLLNRIITEQFTAIGTALSLSGVGDFSACKGAKPSRSLGQYANVYRPFPVSYDANGNPVIPVEINASVLAAQITALSQAIQASPQVASGGRPAMSSGGSYKPSGGSAMSGARRMASRIR
jgi:hypothetical protein